MADPIRVGVVGLGNFGSHHARHYAAHPSARLVAVVDIDPTRAAETAARYGAVALDRAERLAGKVTAVSVAVPTSDHHAVAGRLIDEGLDVFIEKPIAADVASAENLVDRAAAAGIILQVGHIERFSPIFTALRGRLRSPVTIDCVRRTTWSGRATDVDVVLDLMIHDIDLASVLAGAPVVAVAATGASILSPSNDTAEARLTFANGVVATLSASRIAAIAERRLTVTERDRQYVADLAMSCLWRVSPETTARAGESVVVERADALAAEIDSFLTSVGRRRPPMVDGAAGFEAVKVAHMIMSAIAESGRAKPLPPERIP